MQGSILEVSETPAGDELDANHALGVTTLQLIDVSDFDTTGSVEIDGVSYDYTSVDSTTNQMTITVGLVVDLEPGERVNVWPWVIEKWAMVEVQADDDVILALVPSNLWDQLAEGVRDPEEQEPVLVEQREGDWVIADILGTVPAIDGSFIDPTTVPTPPELTDAFEDLAAEVLAHSAEIAQNTTSIENAQETAYAANSLASTADGRISISDYEPSVEDVRYTAVDVNGDPILDANGAPIILTRNEGSMWFARTRARRNYVTNPSFEVNTTHWTSSQITLLRELTAIVISGSYSLKLTNSGVAGNHSALWEAGGTTLRQAAAVGETWTASCYAAAVSGTSNGVYLQIDFLNSGGSSVGTFNSASGALIVDDYQRFAVTATAPATTAYIVIRMVSPTGNESSVWRIDGALLEKTDILGRYMDGRSNDGAWDGVADLSISYLVGGKVLRVFELDDGAWVEKFFSGDTLRDIDASQILRGTMDGERIADYSLPQDKSSTGPVIASEALLAGDLVHVHSVGGLFRMRKASAGVGTLYEAHGYVLSDVGNGVVGFMFSHGYNPLLASLTPGTQFLSTAAGKCSGVPPTDVGTMQQRVGVAVGATVLQFMCSAPVKIT